MDFLQYLTNPFALTGLIVFVLYMALKLVLSHINKGHKKEIESLKIELKKVKSSNTRMKKLLK